MTAVPWNETFVQYPTEARLHLLIAAQAERTPDAVALVSDRTSLTYRELESRACQLARHLRSLGIGPDTLVGISAFRSPEMVVGLQGILKAGGAYVPIDPEYPAERVAFMIQDAGAPVLLTQERVLPRLPAHQARTICLDRDWGIIAREPDTPIDDATRPDNLAYMIYTSGSTGRPKGALNEHRGICNRLLWMRDRYEVGAADVVLQKTAFSFDVSVWEFFLPMLAGARLVLARPGGQGDPAYLADLMRREGVTIAHFVPSMLRAFLDEPSASPIPTLRHVICSGEELPLALQERFLARFPCRLHNLYGPTEAAVDVTHWECRGGSGLRFVPIGQPVANTQIHVVGPGFEPLPVGVEGELLIGGVQVGRGYHRRPELTAERFVPDPFAATPGSRLYRTGDLARWNPAGFVEYLGRIDTQVKIRGHRVELGEIECVLEQHPAVERVVAAATTRDGRGPLLVAHVKAQEGSAVSASSLREFAAARLPEHMVPARFVPLERIPLSPSGKVDRNALPAPSRARPELAQARVAPATELEVAIARLWEDVLAIDAVGIDDRFFDLGGDSLGLVQVHGALEHALGREFPLTTLFEHTTIRTLAAHLARPAARGLAFDAVQDRAQRQRQALAARRPVRPAR